MKKSPLLISSLLMLVIMIAAFGMFATANDFFTPDENSATSPTTTSATEPYSSSPTETEEATTRRPVNLEDVYESQGFTDSDKRVPLNKDLSGDINTFSNKEYIYDRILNSVDFFTSLEGQYYRSSIRHANINYFVDYHIQFGTAPKALEIVCRENGAIEKITKLEDNITTELHNNIIELPEIQNVNFNIPPAIVSNAINLSKTQNISNFSDNAYKSDIEDQKRLDFIALVKALSRKKTDEDGINTWFYRNNLTKLPTARESIVPQECALGFLNDFDLWNISNIETFIGRNTFEISGQLTGSYSEKLNTQNFKMWIDDETGVLLKFECYNYNNELIEKIETTYFSVNNSIENSAFNLPTNINN